jgi:hypothetical protein
VPHTCYVSMSDSQLKGRRNSPQAGSGEGGTLSWLTPLVCSPCQTLAMNFLDRNHDGKIDQADFAMACEEVKGLVIPANIAPLFDGLKVRSLPPARGRSSYA